MRALIDTFVIAPAYLAWDRLREYFTGVRRRHGVLTDDEGLVRLEYPPDWCATGSLSDRASIQLRDRRHRRFVLVFSEAREDFEAGMTLERHSALTRAQLMGALQVFEIHGPDYRHVGGFPAVQYVIEGSINASIFRYLHTTIQGARAFHQVLCWTNRSRFDRRELDRVVDGLSELAGPPPTWSSGNVRPAIPVEPGSAYDVH